MRRLLLTFLALVIAGCGSDKVLISCTASDVPAVALTVRDGQTAAVVLSPKTVIWTRHGFPPDTIATSSELLFIGDKPGTYDILVSASGYANWATNDIVAESDDAGCHPVTVRLTALLQKL